MQKKNICLINESFPPIIDGVANVVVNYASILSDKYGAATVVTPYVPDADDSAYSFPVVRIPSFDLSKRIGYRAGYPFGAETLRLLEDKGFDLIHCHSPFAAAVLARALRERIHVPIVYTYHTKFDIDIANAIRGKLLQEEACRFFISNISSCDEIWTVSRGAGKNLESLGFEGTWRVMPNGVDLPKGTVSEDLIQAVTKDYDLPKDVPVFLFVGRMMWYKGIRIILDALKLLKQRRVDFRMVFVGKGNDLGEITAYAEELELTDCVFFSEPQYDRALIRAWYCRADLFLFPSTFDTNGLVVREAAACSLASVLVRGSCAAEDIEDDVSGFLIEESAGALAEKLVALCAAPQKMKQVGQNAQDMIYISWDDAVAKAAERYDVVMDAYKKGAYPERVSPGSETIRAIESLITSIERSRARMQQNMEAFKDWLN